MQISSISELKALREKKQKQLTYIKVRLYVDYFNLIAVKEQIQEGTIWWKKIMFVFQAYKQTRKFIHWLQREKK